MRGPSFCMASIVKRYGGKVDLALKGKSRTRAIGEYDLYTRRG